MSSLHFNPLTTNAVDLRYLLQTGQITSVQIVERYLEHIELHEPTLNALASIAPCETLRRCAALLDDERSQGNIRGPFHGIPIILKDCFITASELGMTTCAGAVVFAEARASKNAAIVQRLIDAGLIILAKGNMTEFAGMKTMTMMPGWSAFGGQTISAYVGPIKKNERILGHSAPGGSSTGSAVSVAAGFGPLAMGGETIGSIITPSIRAALYAIKPTVGVQDVTGMYRMSDFYDVPGPMAKCASDIITMSELLLGRPFASPDNMETWKGLVVAFLDPEKWNMAEAMCEQLEGSDVQMKEEYEAVIAELKQQGCFVRYPVDMADISALTVNGKGAIVPIAYWDFKNICIPKFVEGFDECHVSSLDDIIAFNEDHKTIAMPEPFTDQDELLKANSYNDNIEEIDNLKQGLRGVAKKILDDIFDRENVNIIAAPGDSSLCIYSAASGYPIAAVPLSSLRYNGRPFGLCLVAREHHEDVLLHFMAAYELMSGPRPVPVL